MAVLICTTFPRCSTLSAKDWILPAKLATARHDLGRESDALRAHGEHVLRRQRLRATINAPPEPRDHAGRGGREQKRRVLGLDQLETLIDGRIAFDLRQVPRRRRPGGWRERVHVFVV